MQETYYKKVGDTYEPVSYYDSNIIDAVPVDCAVMILSKKGSTLRKYDVDIALAPLLAGGEYMREAMTDAFDKADRPTLPTNALTAQESEAWNKLIAIGGEGFKRLTLPATNDLIDAGLKTLMEKMEHVLSDPTCADAYNQFKMCVKLKLQKDNIV